jgi:GT2 family glycosyltransferase
LFWTLGVLALLAGAAWFEVWEGVPGWLVAVEVVGLLAVGQFVLWLRIVLRVRGRWGWHDSAWYTGSCLLAKWPGLQGMVLYWWRSLRGGPRRLIEYKDAVAAPIGAVDGERRPAPARLRQALGVVVIGRNEGARLVRCLASLGEWRARAVYVDSGSTDGSVAHARSVGVDVVELDMSIPFTAARGRNAGFARLRERFADLRFVQFVDGDCEVAEGWLDDGLMALDATKRLAVVFGRCRERERDASVYNRLCDLEWDVPIGPAEACGGNAMMRVEAVAAVGGYDASLIAGEEPELCYRMRELGWSVLCIAAPMVAHDAAMTRFSQWWRRSARAGFVEAEGIARHGRAYPRVRQALSMVFWSVLPLPVLAVGFACQWLVGLAAPCWLAAVGALLLAYGMLWVRISRAAAARWGSTDAAAYATFCLLAKWPGLQGMLTFWWRRWRGAPRRLIEYKQPGPSASVG